MDKDSRITQATSNKRVGSEDGPTRKEQRQIEQQKKQAELAKQQAAEAKARSEALTQAAEAKAIEEEAIAAAKKARFKSRDDALASEHTSKSSYATTLKTQANAAQRKLEDLQKAQEKAAKESTTLPEGVEEAATAYEALRIAAAKAEDEALKASKNMEAWKESSRPDRLAVEEFEIGIPVRKVKRASGIEVSDTLTLPQVEMTKSSGGQSVEVQGGQKQPVNPVSARGLLAVGAMKDFLAVVPDSRLHADMEDSIRAREESPDEWENAQVDALQAATPDVIAGQIETWNQVSQQHALKVQEMQQQFTAARQVSMQKIDALDNDNARAMRDGKFSMSDRVIDGQGNPWSKVLWTERQRLMQQMDQERAEMEEAFAKEQNELERTNRIQVARQARLQELQAEAKMKQAKAIDEQAANMRASGMTGEADQFERMNREYEAREKMVADKFPQDGPARQAALKALANEKQAAAKLLDDNMKAKPEKAADLHSSWAKDLSYDWSKVKEGDDIYLRMKQEAEKRGMSAEDAKFWLTTMDQMDWSKASNIEANAKGLDSKTQPGSTRMLPNGGVLVNPSLLLDAQAFEEALKASNATQEAQDRARAARREEAPAMATEMLKTLRKNNDFATWIEKNTSGSDLERMEQFVAKMREGGATNMALMKVGEGLAGLGKSWTGTMAAITGADMFTQGKVPSMLSAKTWEDRAAAYGYAAAQSEKETNILTSYMAKAAGIAPSVMASLSAGAAAGGLVKGAAAFRGAQAMAQTGFQLKKGADFATAAAKAGGWSDKAATAAGVAGSSIDAGLQSLGGTYVDAYSDALEKEFGSMSFATDGAKPTEEQIIAAKDKARAAALMPAIASGLTTAVITALGGASGVETVFKGKGSQSLADAIKAPLLRKMAGMGLEGGSEFIEEFSDQLAQGAIAQFSYNPEMSPADVLEQAIEAGVLGFVAGAGIKGVQELRGWQRTPEGKAAAEATLADELGRITDPAVKAQAEAVKSVLEGRSFGQLTESQLAALNLKRQGDKFVQADKAVPVGAYEQDGQIVLTDDTLNSALTNVPGLNVYGPASEKARLDQIAEGDTPSKPGSVEAGRSSVANSSQAPTSRRDEIESRLAEIERQSGPREQVTLDKDGKTRSEAYRILSNEEGSLLKELEALDKAESEAGPASTPSPVDQKAQQAATSKANDLKEPTGPQIEANNYKLGKPRIGGIEFRIENPAGSTRKDKETGGKKWSQEMKGVHYGYIPKTEGADGDQVDAFIKEGTEENWDGPVFVIDQHDPKTGLFDEHKVMVGFDSMSDARDAYLAQYQPGWKGLKKIAMLPMSQLADMVKSGKLKNSTPQSTNEDTQGIQETVTDSNPAAEPEADTITAGPDSDASPAKGQDADRDGNAQGEWSIRTQSGRKLTIPASQAATADQAIDIFAGMAERGDLLDTSTIVEPEEGVSLTDEDIESLIKENSDKLLDLSGAENYEQHPSTPQALAAIFSAVVDKMESGRTRDVFVQAGQAFVNRFAPWLKAKGITNIRVAPDLAGLGIAVVKQDGSLYINPEGIMNQIIAYGMHMSEHADNPSQAYRDAASDLIDMIPLHEIGGHIIASGAITKSERLKSWNSLSESEKNRFLAGYNYGNPIRPPAMVEALGPDAVKAWRDEYGSQEWIRFLFEMAVTGRSSESIFKKQFDKAAKDGIIAKILDALFKLLDQIIESKGSERFVEHVKLMEKAWSSFKEQLPEIAQEYEKRAAREGRSIGLFGAGRKPMAGDVSSPIRADEAKPDVGAIGSSQKARAFIEANFKAMAEKMGISLVPNMAGVSARYVVSENGKSRGGYIEYNPARLADRTPGQIMDVMREEIIHAAKDKILVERVMKQKGIKISDPYIQSGQHHIDFYHSIHDMMTPQEREWTKKVYKSHGNRDYVVGSEFDRMVTQREVFGGLTEQAMTKGKKGVSRSKALEAIKRLLKEVEAYVRRMAANNTPAAKQAKAVHTATIKMLIDIEASQKMVQAAAAPSIPLQPAVRISGKVVLGQPGQTHYDVMADWIFKNEMTATERSKSDSQFDKYDRITSDWFGRHDIKTGFMADKFLDRKQAWQMLKDRGLKMPKRVFLPGVPLEPELDSLDLPEIESLNTQSVQAATAPVLPVAPQLNLVYARPDEKRSTNREASNPLDQTAGLGAIEAFGGATQTPALLEWAAENGWLVEGQDLVNRLAPGGPVEEIQGGDEHDVWFDPITQRAIKLTLDDKWIAGTPSGYIESLIRQNAEFGAGYAFEGIVNDNGTARLVLSQPWVIGKPATEDQIDEFFTDRDYGKVKDGMFYHERKKLSVGDALPRNVLRTQDGRTQPIDVQVRVPSERQQNAYEDAIQARSNQAQFATAPVPPFNLKAAGELLADFRKLPLAEEGGDTLNLDGTKYTEGGLVVPVVSRNFNDFKEIKPEDIKQFISTDNIDIATAGGNVAKVGFYKFPNSTAASIDLNIIAPREMRQEALVIGKELEQESLFDLDTFENVKTGATGENPRRPSADEVREIARRLGVQAAASPNAILELDERPYKVTNKTTGEVITRDRPINPKDLPESWAGHSVVFGRVGNDSLTPQFSASPVSRAYVNTSTASQLEPAIRRMAAKRMEGMKPRDIFDALMKVSAADTMAITEMLSTGKLLDLAHRATGMPTTGRLKALSTVRRHLNRLKDETASGDVSQPIYDGVIRTPVNKQAAITTSSRVQAAAAPSLTGLPSKVKIPGVGEREFGPWQEARDVASSYMAKAGLPYNPPRTYAKVDKERAERVAAAFEEMKHDPQDPAVKASYQAMINETLAQWEAIKATGLKVEPVPAGAPDPYEASPRLAQIDAMENNHLWFFQTDNGFGNNVTGFDPKDNPLLELTGEVINGHKMRANDVFRIVHDYFGHFKEGVGFRADGEENAWRQHSSMYSPQARGAMTTETRGQNSWLNFGPYGEKNRTAKTGDTVFADQKIGLLPEWIWYDGAEDKVAGGAAFAKFFNETQETKNGGATFSDATDILQRPLEGHESELQSYLKFGSNFQKHIMASIPGFLDARIRVMRGMTEAAVILGEGGKEVSMLDITSSEGYFTKAWAEQAQARGVNATADALDALPAFEDGFKATPQVGGVRYLLQAWGESFIDPTTKIRIPRFKANKKYSIIHEGMGFQFFTPTREAELQEVKSIMAPDGLFVTLEKFKNADYKEREILKDQYKSQFFSKKQMDDKAATVLNKADENAVGMSDYQFDRIAYEDLLKKLFKNVIQIYSSGNFAGYYASDSDDVMRAAVNNTGDTTTKFNEESTPRFIAGSAQFAAAPELDLGRKGDPAILRQKNVKRLIEKTAAAHPEANEVEYIKDGKAYRLGEKGMPIAVPQEYNLLESRLFKESAKGLRGDARRTAYVNALASKLEGFLDSVRSVPEIMAGREWYRVAREKLKKVFGDDTLLFAQLLAATSARTPVQQNFEQALDAIDGIKSGRFDGYSERYHEAAKNLEEGTLVFNKDFGSAEAGDVVTPQSFREWLDSEGLLPRRENGKKYNANSMQVLNVIAGVWREKLGGPKTAQFADNLTGASMEATVDVWAARTLHRLSNEHQGRWRILPAAETGVGNEDFEVGQQAFRIAADRLGMSPDDLQGVLWFAEKRHWSQRGWTRAAGSELSDFSSLLDYVVTSSNGRKALRLNQNQGMFDFDEGSNTSQANRQPQAAGMGQAEPRKPSAKREGARASDDRRKGPVSRSQEDLGQPLFASAPAFYSKLERFIEARMPTTADSAAVAAMIELPTSGVKKDEIKSSGIRQWLASRGDKVKRQEVLDYLRGEGQIKFNEVRLSGGIDDMPAADVLDIARNNLEDRGQSYEEWEAMEEPLFDAIKDWKADKSESNRGAVERIIGIPLGELEMPPGSAATRFSEQVLPGGENYRELVVTMPMPKSRIEYEIEEMRYDDGTVRFRARGPNFRSRAMATRSAAEEELKKMRVDYDEIDSRAQSFTSRHFPKITNYLAHARLNDRVDADGKPGTLFEELQSDRHQEGRKKGYKAQDPSAAFDKIQEKYFNTANSSQVTGPEKDGLFKAAINVGTPDYFAAFGRTQDEAKQNLLRHLITKDPDYSEVRDKPISGADNRIPDAPYRKDWPLMLFKRGLVDAVANGKEWIGWTTGDTQNERYGLEKHLNEVSLSKPFSGDARVHLEAYDKSNRRIIDKVIEQDEVAEHVGEELAAKLESMPFTKSDVETSNGSIVSRDMKRLRGLDLKVKGEGMRKFYDKMVVDEVRKYVKQWGAGVAKSGLPMTAELWRGMSPSQKMAYKGDGVAHQIWRVDITPQMRESIEATGQPLFATSPNLGKDYSKLTDAEYDAIPIHEIKRHRNLQRLTETRRALQALAETGGSAGGYTTPAITRVLKEQGFKEIASIDQLGYKWDLTKVEGGAEHFVWVTNEQDGPVRAIKITRGNRGRYGNYGISHHVVPYVERIEAANQIFGDDMRIEGYHADGRLWVSQPWIDGIHPEPDELRKSLTDRGWYLDEASVSGSTYLSPDGRIMLRDAHMLNFIKRNDDGEIVPLDIQIESEATERMRLHPTDEAYATNSIGALIDSASSVKDFGFTEQNMQAAAAPDYLKGLGPDPASALLTKMAKQLPTNEQMAGFGEKAEVVLPGATPEQRQRAVAEWVRKSETPPEKVKQWEAKARRMIESDKQGVIDQVIQNYFDGADFGSPELAMAASMLTPELFKEAVASGNPELMRKAQAFAYAHGAGATQAGRTLRALNNPHKANKDHIREMFAKMLVTVGPRERARIATAPTPMAKEKKVKELQQKLRELERKVANGEISRAKETAALRKMLADTRAQLDKQQLIESYTKSRSEKVRETLKLEGMTEDDIFIDAEDRLAAQESDLVRRALENHPEAQHEAIRYLMRGYSHEEVSKLVGMPKLAIAALHEKFRNQTLKKEVAAHVKSGNSVMDLIRNGLKKVLGLRASAPVEWGNVNKVPGLAADLKAKEAQRAANAAANASKAKDVSVDMTLSQEIDRQLALLMPTSTQVNGANNLKAVIVRRKGQEEVTMHVPFNPADFQSIYRLARAISIAEASTFDKMTEWWINGMLSGPETNFVNIAGNTIATAIHFGPQRMMEMGWNIFLRDEGSASFGELKYIARGILPGIREGMKNAALAFSAEGDITGHKYLDEPMQLTFDPNGDIAKIGGYRGPAIAGKKGRIIRISGRLLRAMDALFKTFIAQAEVGAQAYRLGRIAGKTGADLESFITKQINTPGSKAWHLSMQEATELTFQSDNWLTDLAKTVTQTDQSKIERLMSESVEAEADGNFMKARTAKASANMLIIWSSLLKLVFPFVKTPANILRVGVRKSPLGSLVLASHAVQVFGRGVINMRNGKAFIDGADKAEFVRLLSEQTQAWVMAGFFLSAIEGDDDDDKKKLLLVGGRAPMDYGGREAAGRDYGGTYLVIVRDDDGKETRMPFGRYDPVATALGTTIDTIKQIKDSIRRNRNGEEGGDVGSTIKAMMADFMNQASDKSFLQGFSSMMKHVDSIRQGRDVSQTIGKSLQYSILTALVPNIIRQPLRNLDDKVRDYDKVYDGYTALPIGDLAEPKIDIFGRDVEKGEMFPGSRLIIRSADKQQPRLPIQEHIQAWNSKNLNEQFKPTGLRSTDYYGYVGKQKQPITDPVMRSEMDRAIGQEFARRSTIMAENNDPQNLPEDFGEKLKDLYSDVKSEVRKKMLASPFSSIRSSITQQPKP